MNVTFNLHKEDLLGEFVKQAEAADLYALKGHRSGRRRTSLHLQRHATRWLRGSGRIYV